MGGNHFYWLYQTSEQFLSFKTDELIIKQKMNITQKKSSTPKVNKLGEVYQKIIQDVSFELKSFNFEQGSTILYLR